MTPLQRLEAKVDRLLAARDIDPAPGSSLTDGARFAPGSGPLAEWTPPAPVTPVDPRPHIAAARAAIHAKETTP